MKHDFNIYYTDIKVMNPPPEQGINYALSRIPSEHDNAKQILVGTSDDGTTVIWNLAGVRNYAEAHFRLRHGFHQTAGLTQAQAMTGNKSGRHHSVMISPSKRPSSPGGYSDASEGTFNSMDSPTSSPIQRGGLFDFDRDRELDTARGSRDSLTFLTSTGKMSDQPSVLKKDGKGRVRMTDLSGRVPASSFGDMKDANIFRCFRSFKGHSDAISCCVDMIDHGCFLNISLDGYIRVWNTDGDCLGEMPLPNLTVRMKDIMNRTVVPPPQWKFILERMDVTPAHHDQAVKLVKFWRHSFKDPSRKMNKNRTISRQLEQYLEGSKAFDEDDDGAEELPEENKKRIELNMVVSFCHVLAREQQFRLMRYSFHDVDKDFLLPSNEV